MAMSAKGLIFGGFGIIIPRVVHLSLSFAGSWLIAYYDCVVPTNKTMKVALHICCGVCATEVTEKLASEGHHVLGLFYNPNIHPLEEYQRRLEAAHIVASKTGFPLEVAPYVPEEWLRETAGLENEPEGGKRCEVCFRLRLGKTYLMMKDWGGDAFATTLTVSPRKLAVVVNRVGVEIGGEKFLARDFKKQEGFKRAMALAKKWALYRQGYCGCLYSMKRGWAAMV